MFTKATLQFLDELAANNSRAWLEENKPRYEALVREPALDFIEAMGSRAEVKVVIESWRNHFQWSLPPLRVLH